MLAIRLQRVGRSGLAQYRIIVQEAQKQPTSGRIVAFVGTYNPHTKEAKIQVEVAQKFLDNGAQPSPRVVKLLVSAGVKMPSWVAKPLVGNKSARKAEKLRKNRPASTEPSVKEPADEAIESESTEASEAPQAEVATDTDQEKDAKETEEAPAE